MEKPKAGEVVMIGAGPGDADLLTLKALREIKLADIVIYDRLVSDDILALIATEVPKIFVGKFPASHPLPANFEACNHFSQSQINQTMIDYAKKGKRVVRLKGGDPMIYGRAQEEIAALQAHHIKITIVPGITTAQAVAAICQTSLTSRDKASAVMFLTGHQKQDQPLAWDWPNLVNPLTSLVIYMGMSTVKEWSENLMRYGLPANHPVLAVSHATTAKEQRLISTLADISQAMKQSGFTTPTLFIVGAVVANYRP